MSLMPSGSGDGEGPRARLEDDYAVGLEMSYQVPEHIQSLVVSRCSEIRASRHPTVEH